jgi:hypothetical protein
MSPYACSNLPEDIRGPRTVASQQIFLFGLAPGGVYPATGVDRRGALLPHHFTLTERHDAIASNSYLTSAVYFLWHFP